MSKPHSAPPQNTPTSTGFLYSLEGVSGKWERAKIEKDESGAPGAQAAVLLAVERVLVSTSDSFAQDSSNSALNPPYSAPLSRYCTAFEVD
jgi:hypothetical protein